MSSNVAKVSELESVLCNDDKTSEGVLHFVTAFTTSRFFRPFDSVKGKGVSVTQLLVSLITFRLHGSSIARMQQPGRSACPAIDDNTFYRLMNNPLMRWRGLLMGLAKQFAAHVQAKGDGNPSVRCFVLDDTDLEKTGKTIERVGRIFNHVTKRYPFGFKLLLLALWDGKSLVSLDFSLHCERGGTGKQGLTVKEKRAQFSKVRKAGTPSAQRYTELDQEKHHNAVAMLRRAVKNGVTASYVLMDSWFVNDYTIKAIRAIKGRALHVLGMCKVDNRKYTVDGRAMNAHQLVAKFDRKRAKHSRKYRTRYIAITADYKGEKVRLFLMQYNHASRWTILLTSDLSLSFVQAIELYQIRWTIEVLFKECKQYLRLGCSQNTDFDGQVADATLALVTHTILTLQKRFGAYETLGDLFRETQQHLLELTLWERLITVFLKMVMQLVELLNVDIEELIEKLLQDSQASRKLLALLSFLRDDWDKCEETYKSNI